MLDLDQILVDWPLLLGVANLNAKLLDSHFRLGREIGFKDGPDFVWLDATNDANAKLVVHWFKKPRFEKIILLLEVFIGKVDRIGYFIFFWRNREGIAWSLTMCCFKRWPLMVDSASCIQLGKFSSVSLQEIVEEKVWGAKTMEAEAMDMDRVA